LNQIIQIRTWIQFLGPVTTLIGVALSIWGTYLLTKFYHTFKLLEFLASVCMIAFLFIVGKRQKARQLVLVATKFGKLNSEERAVSLIGICLIFVGFVFQAIGAFCWGIDSVWGIINKIQGSCG
jgi:hypothetical protein